MSKERVEQVKELVAANEDRPVLTHASDAVAVLRLPTFSKQNGEIVYRERGSWDRPTGKEKALVVDTTDSTPDETLARTLAALPSLRAATEAEA